MRGGRSFLALLAIALGLGAYIYFVEMERTPGEADAKPKVFTVEADKIQELTIRSAAGERTTLRKADGAWKLTAPVSDAADQSEVSAITSNLASLEVQEVVDEQPASLSAFGLDPPRMAIEFKVEGDAAPKRLELGDKTSTGSDLYAKLGAEPKVFVIPGYLESTFNRGTFDLRDKTILKFARESADALDVTTPDHTLRLVKEDAEWRLTAPVAARADFGAVEGLLSQLANGQMKALTAAEAADLRPYGLDKPAVTARVGAGSAQATLAVGKETPEGTVYARDLSRPAIFTVEASLATELKKAPSEYRRKDVFEFRPFNATKIELTQGGQRFAFEKTRPPQDSEDQTEKWRQTAPAARDVETAKMDTLLSSFSNLRAQSFVDSTARTGLDKPELTLTVHFDEGKAQETVRFARRGDDVHASRADEPGAMKLDATDYGNAMKAVEEIKK